MKAKQYLGKFQQSASRLDKALLARKQMEVATGIVLDSTFLKLYKTAWVNPGPDPLTVPSRIFFSVWVNDSTLRDGKLFYNIHALKLRQLKGYSIESRKFAALFRAGFEKHKPYWPNVSVDFGPLTLMEGWTDFDPVTAEATISGLAEQFLEMEYIVDETLDQFR